ncbi:MAG TPA: porin [Myxococcota bacterium]|nr:porin [Myxococcota bacterium]
MLPALTLVALLSSAPADPPASPGPTPVKLKIGGTLQPELNLFPSAGDDSRRQGFQFRRLRTNLSASWGVFSFKLVPEFAGSRVRGQDVFLDVALQKDDCGSLVLRVGKDKPPISIDLLQSSTNIPLLERGPTAQLVADRDIGVQLLLKRGILEATVMLANGTPDVSNADAPTGDFEVFASAGVTLGPIQLSAAGSYGMAEGEELIPGYRSSGRTTLFEEEDPGRLADTRWRVGGALRATAGPMLLWVEAVQSEHLVSIGAWQAGASLLIGKADNAWNKYDEPGDVELAVRAGQLGTFLFGGGESPRGYTSAAFAASWTIDEHIKLMAGYDLTLWSGALSGREDEHMVGLRLQMVVLESL